MRFNSIWFDEWMSGVDHFRPSGPSSCEYDCKRNEQSHQDEERPDYQSLLLFLLFEMKRYDTMGNILHFIILSLNTLLYFYITEKERKRQ